MGACAVTKPVLDEPKRDPKASPFGFGEWYISPDRKIWFPRQDWRAGEGNKVILVRPAGERLDITGQRIYQPAPPVHIGAGDFVSDYPGSTFEVIGLTFPTEGCWEMTAKTRATSCDLRRRSHRHARRWLRHRNYTGRQRIHSDQGER